MRAQLSIAESDIAVLSVGRLAFKRKSHPVPMYLALQRAKQATGAQVHLIQAGQFEDDKEEGAFHAAASEFCPDVRTHVVGGRHAFRDQSVWFAGDIFLSLSDNIQETFGLAPVEAMAVGLPAVVSDWDGYRDTIRDGVDGFRIVTTFPQPSSGVDLSERYYGFANYRHYYGTVAMSTAVDIDACAEALARLIREPALRNRMGASGRLRARTTYDWRVVLRAYRQLWSMLADERQGNDVVAPTSLGRAPYPLCDDPFRVFSAHATRTLAPDTVLSLTNASANEVLDRLRRSWLTHFGAEWRLGREAIVRILGRIERSGSITVAELADDASVPQAQLQRTLAYLLKFGIVRIADRD
jgi:DNA-binding transcriptional ArsR family regulator